MNKDQTIYHQTQELIQIKFKYKTQKSKSNLKNHKLIKDYLTFIDKSMKTLPNNMNF